MLSKLPMRLVFAILTGALLAACVRSPHSSSKSTTAGPYTHVLRDVNEYYAYAGRSGNASAVKFTVDDTADGAPLYLQNTSRYPFHAEFLAENLPKYKNMSFDDYVTYIFGGVDGAGKELSAGAIMYSESYQLSPDKLNGTIAFEYYAGTGGKAPQAADFVKQFALIERTYRKLVEGLPFAADRIAILIPTTLRFKAPDLIKLIKDAHIPVLWDSDRLRQEFFKTGDVEVYHAASSYGYLRTITPADLASGNYSSKEILLMNEIPLDIGPVAGIITSIPQTPLAHIMLRALNQNIPDMFLLGAMEDKLIQSKVGKLVQFVANADKTYTIKSEAEIGPGIQGLADDYFANRIPKLPPLLANLSVNDLLAWPSKEVSASQIQSYGAKGINFALLDKALRRSGIDRSSYDGGFLIPFSYYDRHMNSTVSAGMCSKAAKECKEELGSDCALPLAQCQSQSSGGKSLKDFVSTMIDPNATPAMNDNFGRRSYLAFLRELVERAPMNGQDLEAIKAQIVKAYPTATRIRFRSSTNAEDLPGLNGAGLYESKSGCIQDDINLVKGVGLNEASACRTPLELTRIQERLPKLDPVKDAEAIANLTEDLTQKYPLDKNIKKVWASLWTDRAYITRDYYNLKHNEVYMGILVAPSFVDESANGVLVVGDSAEGTEITISTQIEDFSITNPILRGASPEYLSVVRKPDGSVGPIAYLRRSNLVSGKVLSEGQISSLVQQVFVVHSDQKLNLGDRFTGKTDIEFIVDAKGQVLIKQARPLPKTVGGMFQRE